MGPRAADFRGRILDDGLFILNLSGSCGLFMTHLSPTGEWYTHSSLLSHSKESVKTLMIKRLNYFKTLTPSNPQLSNLNLSFLISTSSLSRQNSKSLKPFGMVAFSTSLWNILIGLPDQVLERQLDELDATRKQNSSRPLKRFLVSNIQESTDSFWG